MLRYVLLHKAPEIVTDSVRGGFVKEKLGSLLNRSVGAFQIIMKNKLVNMGCFLFAGILHVMDPRGGLRWTAGLLALCVALYALISFIFVLSNKNETVGKGKSLAGSLVHGVMEGNKNPVVQGQKLMSKSRVLDKESKNSNSKWDRRMQMLENKQKQEPKAGKVVLCIFYSILLIASVFLVFWSDITITAIHILIGVLMVADGISDIATAVAARRNHIPMKSQTLSIVTGIVSVLIGAAFIILSWQTADLTMVICGVVLIVKALVDLFLIIRNREVISSAKDTINKIKQQKKNS